MKRTVVSLGFLFAVGCGQRDPIRYLPVPPGYAQEPPAGSGADQSLREARVRVDAAVRGGQASARVERSLRQPAPASASRLRASPTPSEASGAAEPKQTPLLVDLNGATLEELQTLPRVGPAMAARIAAKRPFRRVDDLRRVKGVGASTFRALRPLVAVAPPSPAKQVH